MLDLSRINIKYLRINKRVLIKSNMKYTGNYILVTTG